MGEKPFPLAKLSAFAKWTEGLANAWNAGTSQGRRGKNIMTTRAEMIRDAIESHKALDEKCAQLAEENAELKRKCHLLEYGTAPGGYAD